MNKKLLLLLIAPLLGWLPAQVLTAQSVHVRHNQLGYRPDDPKILLVLSSQPVQAAARIQRASGEELAERFPLTRATQGTWGNFEYQYRLDLSSVRSAGRYLLLVAGQPTITVEIQDSVYPPGLEVLTSFMRQQRCGYNPYFDVVCHPGDGRIFYAPVADSTYYDFTGGWHDAGDQLKYLITGSNATARMLMAYEEAPEHFADRVDALGHPQPNGIPDILDEARWGLDWILRLHPHPDWLVHQIADDRDHRGFKLPHEDNADYGWGSDSYRPAYFADGRPQGLGEWKSQATGVANLAGRCAAALAKAAMIWQADDLDPTFAGRCRRAAVELYALGKQKPGYQQGNSYGAPYRYNEDSWTDDMEWGAAELYKLTREPRYLTEAIHYAYQSRDQGWMKQDSMDHYREYPFMNMGHYALYSVAPDSVQDSLAYWYRQNLERVAGRAATNAFEIGVPFLWCSNNLMVNFITQALLYEKMTGNRQYHRLMAVHRDWLLGRNPWGTSMFTGLPEGGEVPEDVHLPATQLLGKTPAGGLIDGPIYRTIYDNLLGLTLHDPDEFADFQNDFVVYHDDIGDYSTNEPTMDGTADAILMMVLLAK